MAKRTTRKPATRQAGSAQITWSDVGRWVLRRQVIGVLLATVGAITFVTLLSSDQGKVSAAWALFLTQVFGVGAYPVALLVLAGGMLLLFYGALERPLVVRWQVIVGAEVFFFTGLGFLHLTSSANPLTLAQQGRRGGFVGWMFWRLMTPLFGRTISAVLLGLLAIGGLYLAAGIPWRVLFWRTRWALAQVGVRLRRAIASRRVRAVVQRPAALSLDEPALAAVDAAAPERKRSANRRRSAAAPPMPVAAAPGDLPPIELLISDEAKGEDDASSRQRAQIIEETLAAFGIPAEVVEWNRGPAVTQFGVEPGFVEKGGRQYKIRVSKILSLQNDLALALAAAPIRIEAPVPGRAVIGIEVPNEDKALVGLRDILASEQYTRLRSPLKLGLGRDVSGAPVVTDLTRMPHLLIAGTTNSGKSVCLNAIIVSLLYQHTPETLQLLLIDPKRVELTKYRGLPHLVAPVIVDTKKVVGALRWLIREMETRYKTFAEAGARNLTDYNRITRKRHLEPMPMIVMVIDELADLMLAAPEEVERSICRLAQMARATGIHLVIATQRPSVDVVTGLIKANFPSRISFAVSSQVDSRVILDTPGAEKLLGQGDMLFMAPDSSKLQRIQGSYVSDREIDALMAWFVQRRVATTASAALPQEEEAPPWEEMSPEDDADEALLEQAASLVRERNHASASFLQRQMRIGYPRAARLIDQLEERGIVGPKQEGGRPRTVLAGHEGEDDSEGGAP
jgi:DNA segregation ATPase FtsK/SpoIIIE, S-DNA-T family